MIKEGDAAPDFETRDADGNTASFHMTTFIPEPFRAFQRNGAKH